MEFNSTITCDYDNLQKYVNKCEFASKYCNEESFNLYKLHFCRFQENYFMTATTVILVITLCFYILSTTANKYLSLSLTKIADKLKLSPSLTAMTFLSFGNGAPDIISSFIASSRGGNGIGLMIGSLIGSGVFISILIFSLVILFSSNTIIVSSKDFNRQMIFYFLALLFIVMISIKGHITYIESIAFFSIYFINLGISIYSSADYTEKLGVNNDINSVAMKIERVAEHLVKSELKSCISRGILKKAPEQPKKLELETEEQQLDEADQKLLVTANYDDGSNCEIDEESPEIMNYPGLFYRIKRHYFHNSEDFKKFSLPRKIIYVLVEFPITASRDLSIPPVDQSGYNKVCFLFFPLFSFMFGVILLGAYNYFIENIIILSVCLGCLLLLSLILRIKYYSDTIPDQMVFILCITNFCMSIIWISTFSSYLVNALTFIGTLLNIPFSFLGLTFLAIGNSTPDASLDISLAMAGYGELAISGTISAPNFNIVIGLGLSFLRSTIPNGTLSIDFFTPENKSAVIAFVMLFSSLLVSYISTVCNDYVLSLKLAKFLIFMFSIFVVVVGYVNFYMNE